MKAIGYGLVCTCMVGVLAFSGCGKAPDTPPTDTAQVMDMTNTPIPTPTPDAVTFQKTSVTNTPVNTPSATPAVTPTPDFDLQRVDDEDAQVLGHDVNLRSGPGTDYEIIDVINYRTDLTITGKTEQWYRVEVGDDEGFMLKELIAVGGVPTPTPKPSYTVKRVDNEKAQINAKGVNLRVEPGTDYEIVDELAYGTDVVITGKTENWYRVKVDGKKGFVLKEFVAVGGIKTSKPSYTVKEVDDEQAQVNAKSINLRSGPGTDYDVVKKLSYGTDVVITGKTENWYRVKVDGKKGFVSKELVTVGGIKAEKEESSDEPSHDSRYSEEDIYLAAKLIYAEGKNQSEESFLAMANVLYNRCNSSRFGGSVEREVYRSGQFTVVDNSGFEALKPSEKALDAAKAVFWNGKRTIPDDVMFFRAARLGKNWGSREYYDTIGANMYFY